MPTSNYVDKIKQDGTSYDIHDTELRNSKGQANGIASLDATGKVPSSQLPDSTDSKVTQTATTTDANYEVLFSETADNTTRTEGAGKAATLRFNPSKGALMEGYYTVATGYQSHAEGYHTCASGAGSHAEGGYGDDEEYSTLGTFAIGENSHAEGFLTTAYGAGSHAEGIETLTNGNFSHAEGCNTIADDDYAHAEGNSTTASGNSSHAEGNSTTASGTASHAEGSGTYASGNRSHAEGFFTIASGTHSHAEGCLTTASDIRSHAEGSCTCASGKGAHAEGGYASSGDQGTFAIGENSHAEGYLTTANGIHSHAEGNLTRAYLDDSHAEGYKTTVIGAASHAEGNETSVGGDNSHAEGRGTVVSSNDSHAEGVYTTASGEASHVEGVATLASGESSHAEGTSTQATGNGAHAEGGYSTTQNNGTFATGENAHAEGYLTTASGKNSHAEGNYTCANGIDSHAEGTRTKANSTDSHAEGSYTYANGTDSHAEGYRTSALAYASHAEGYATSASGSYSHAEGSYNSASGKNSHAEGNYTCANGTDSHAEGYQTRANSADSHAEGSYTCTSGTSAHAEGYDTIASGKYSHAAGEGTCAAGQAQTVVGKFNIADTTSLFIIGNGTSSARSNALLVASDGTTTLGASGSIASGNSQAVTGGAVYTALGNKLDASLKGAANGVAELGSDGKVPSTQLPTIPAAQIQSDYAQNDNTKLDYIKNKPTLGTAAAKDIPATGNASSSQVVLGNDTRLTDARPASDVSAWAKASTKPTYTASEVGAIATTAKGAANGVAELDSAGLVPSSQLPSYVDDVIEVDDYAHLPITGESGKIYITKDTDLTYRWSGTTYVEISKSLALGETSSTAYRGDRGKTAYDHATETRLTTATASGLYKVASTAQGHIASLTAVTKADITALGIPGSDTNTTYSLTQDSSDGHKITLTPSTGSAQTITIPDNDSKVTSSANHYTPATASGQDKSASASGATAAWSIDVVKGITLNTDGKGHVTGISVISGKIPGNPNTDRYVNSAAFADDTTNNTNSPVKMTLTRAGSDTQTVTGNIPKVSSSSAGVAPKGAAVSSQSQSTKFLREDGTWAAPSYPTVNNATFTIQKNGTTVKTFTANASSDVTANITVPTKVSELTNDSGYTTNTGTVTSVATGAGLTGGTIQGAGTIKAYMKSETKATYDSNTITNTQNKQYAVVPDKTGYLSVNVPWENTWRGIQNNLTSDSTSDSLSAAQGKALANGSARDNTKVAKAGDTMTGLLTTNAGITTKESITVQKKDDVAWTSSSLPAIIMKGASDRDFKFKFSTEGKNVDVGWDWTAGDGAGAFFRAADASTSPGCFGFYARQNTTTSIDFIGYPDGKLIWNSRRVVTSTNNTAVGGTTTPVYVDANGNVTALSYTIAKSVPSDADFTNTTYSLTQDASDGHKITLTPSSGTAQTITIPDNNTWRPVQNNLTSDSTTDSLSAAQGKALANGSARDSTKLPLAGGTMTGDIIFNKTGATDLTQVQMKCGANDYGRIAAGGTSNAGYLEIATADDGNEPIYARQYTGVYTSLQRTATILDGSGNTSFPGKLTVSKAINELLTGSGTTAQDKGSGVSPRYFPAKWYFNKGIATPADGDMVTIKIPCAGHDFGVFLSLDNGTTYKPIGLKTQDNGRLTTHYPSGRIITLVYDSTAVVDSVFAAAGADARSNITGAWKVITSYLDGNTYDRNVFGWTNIKAGSTALVAGNIIVGKDGVFHHLKDGTVFDITYPILYLAANISANGTNSNVYNSINFTVTTTQSITLTNYLPVYIKGTLNGNLFTPVSTTPLTQTIPTAWDGYDYIELGMATGSTNIYLEERHKIFAFRCGIFAEQIHNAMNAVKAWQDSDGNGISTTYLKKSGGTITGALALNGDLQLKPSSSSSNDSPDIVWYYGNGQEKARLWTADTYSAASGLTYRLYKSDGTSLYNGTIPLTDTKNTAGSTDTSSKIFLIGATSQAANPQTYSDNEVYATSGVLTTKSVQVGGTAATMQYNSTNKCIDFVFA